MFEFLKPVSEDLLEFVNELPEHAIGKQLDFYTLDNEPELKEGGLVLFSVIENRNDPNGALNKLNFDQIRKQFYRLAKGNWEVLVYDFGQILTGETVSDTYFAVKELTKQLHSKKCIPIMLGGSQDLMYAQYRAYDPEQGMVNLVNIDACFDLGNVDLPITNQSYVGKIVVDQPYNLFNYTNLGYQSYYVAPEELDLLNRMFFDGYRLGEVAGNLRMAEPIMRDANIVGIDCNSVSSAYYGVNPNGFTGREICALSRYAGISNKVSSFGIYEYNSDICYPSGDQLIAQLVWYFIEGVSVRWNESGVVETMDVIHYQVPVNEEVVSFYKSRITERWWMEITYSSRLNNNLISNALLPCTYEDYIEACDQILPERWYNAKMKFEM
ncbi:formimidoylglutamase [Aquimarina agarilytica]|uniref:formimidoylglutamase n=1 Tax=Aquimarina agarilytica TaxID=1087449 RepID=UPI0002882D99|nr:formimidoylglutamase [Aquimarina agarilytica]